MQKSPKTDLTRLKSQTNIPHLPTEVITRPKEKPVDRVGRLIKKQTEPMTDLYNK